MFIVYMFASMIYFGLSLSGGTLSDDPFAYMALAGLMEVPSYTLTVPVVDKFGRRRPGVACFLFCGVTLLALAAIPEGAVLGREGGKKMSWGKVGGCVWEGREWVRKKNRRTKGERR